MHVCCNRPLMMNASITPLGRPQSLAQGRSHQPPPKNIEAGAAWVVLPPTEPSITGYRVLEASFQRQKSAAQLNHLSRATSCRICSTGRPFTAREQCRSKRLLPLAQAPQVPLNDLPTGLCFPGRAPLRERIAMCDHPIRIYRGQWH